MQAMNTRQKELLEYIEQEGSLRMQMLISHFNASEATIRRDISYLEDQKRIIRRRGEVFAIKKEKESAFTQREHLNQEAKQKIAQIAASLIDDYDTIILDAGTTTLEIARLLTHRTDLTILTNSLPVANTIAPSNISLSLA
ncbi:MAG: DeoR/GlpR transcriptional regulator, partial [Spirochaetia bacterium]|nr:DeoR/GlpR transcriptional regulator [Spirochaetia bacterium]